MLHHINWAEVAQFSGMNVGALAFQIHFQWFSLLPQPDRIIEWLFGLGVSTTLMVVNITKIYFMIKEKKGNKRTKK